MTSIPSGPRTGDHYPVFFKILAIAVIGIVVFGYTRINNDKERLYTVSGKIVAMYQAGSGPQDRNGSWHLSLQGYPFPFKLPASGVSGLEHLRPDNQIKIYYYHEPHNNQKVNVSARLIEYGGKVIFCKTHFWYLVMDLAILLCISMIIFTVAAKCRGIIC